MKITIVSVNFIKLLLSDTFFLNKKSSYNKMEQKKRNKIYPPVALLYRNLNEILLASHHE